jgi:hypothetical protein
VVRGRWHAREARHTSARRGVTVIRGDVILGVWSTSHVMSGLKEARPVFEGRLSTGHSSSVDAVRLGRYMRSGRTPAGSEPWPKTIG